MDEHSFSPYPPSTIPFYGEKNVIEAQSILIVRVSIIDSRINYYILRFTLDFA